ncbi:MAG: NAD(P)/FAD-dependent oxidoreductase [Chloroflexi bacterium]|nr:NAD(P)/FAD-dependent oxidoreductase [Chloroflexota bacterium]
MAPRPRVVVVGAGFGGLWAARTLAGYPLGVLLIDRNNYHTFLPLLYQVAAAELQPEDIAHPVRSLLRGYPNAQFIFGRVQALDLASKSLEVDGRMIHYDYLILATGSTSYFFGVEGAAENAFSLKTLQEAITLRSHILTQFEKASDEQDKEVRHRLLTFSIVGGGPTGVEYAGALAELIQGSFRKDYPLLDFQEVRVILLEALENLLPDLPNRLREYAQRRLKKMGVEVRLRAKVKEITKESLFLDEGTIIPTATVVWTAGVRGDPAAQAWGLPTAKNGQVEVLPSLQAPGHPEVYVVGDLASVEEKGHHLPMIAPVAIQQGLAAARNIGRQVVGLEPVSFRYRERGTMVTIGRNAAVASVFGWNFTGFLAWLVWLGVHLFNLIGFRNRLLVLINWAWDYFLYERAVRLILVREKRGISLDR